MIGTLLWLACTPALTGTFSKVFSRSDPVACTEEHELNLVLDPTYWEEWRDPWDCKNTEVLITGADGLCYRSDPLCNDAPPLITDDPVFSSTAEQRARCDLYQTDTGYDVLCGD